MSLLDGDGFLVRIELQNELLQIEEGLLMLGSLPHLNDTLPVILGLDALTALTDLIDDLELNNTGLMESSAATHLLLHGELHLDALRVRLGPDESGVDKLHLVEALDSLEADAEQFT